MIRLFIACPLTGEVKQRIGQIIETLRPVVKNIRWVKTENLHITLRFLGDTEERLVGRLGELIDHVAATHEPVPSNLNELGGFPDLRRARVVWIGHHQPEDGLARIARQIELKVRELRFPKEKKRFTPHLTIGRLRFPDSSGALAQAIESYQLEPISVVYDRITLFKSTLTPSGPIYEKLHEANLGHSETFNG